MDLNNPEVRQQVLTERLTRGLPLVAAAVAEEFTVSVDTVRRDLIALEQAGSARRVRGGAIPMIEPAAALRKRARTGTAPSGALIDAALRQLVGATTLLLDGGLTVLALARALRPALGLVVVTPSPFVAVACHEQGLATVLLGGRVSEQGGIAVGPDCEAALGAFAADIAVMGACGLDATFGLSSDDLLESAVKRRMALAARRTIVLADQSKIGRRARHRTLGPTEIDCIVTDASRADLPPLPRPGYRDGSCLNCASRERSSS